MSVKSFETSSSGTGRQTARGKRVQVESIIAREKRQRSRANRGDETGRSVSLPVKWRDRAFKLTSPLTLPSEGER